MWVNAKKTIGNDIMERLFGKGKLFDLFGIDKQQIKSTEHFVWSIDNDNYKEFVNKNPRQFIKSPIFKTQHGIDHLEFYFKCYPKFSQTSPNVALFLYMDYLHTPPSSENCHVFGKMAGELC